MYNRRCNTIEAVHFARPGLLRTDVAGARAVPRFTPVARPTLAPNEVSVALLYCGVGFSDIELARRSAERSSVLIGQEIIGRIQAMGDGVRHFAVGDIVGIGTMAASCGKCAHCQDNLEQYCLEGARQTRAYQFGRMRREPGQAFARNVVVTDRFLIRIPPQADLPTTAPLLGAAIAPYSAMQHWELKAGERVGVIGMGGLGHMAVKLAAARGAHVTVFTTSTHKLTDARTFGARQAVLWNDEAAFEQLAGQFDLLISTVPQGYSVSDFMDLLKLNGTLVNVGTTDDLQDTCGASMSPGRRSVAASVAGGIAETQALVNYCIARQVRPEIELIGACDIPRLIETATRTKARYRYVIDFAQSKHH